METNLVKKVLENGLDEYFSKAESSQKNTQPTRKKQIFNEIVFFVDIVVKNVENCRFKKISMKNPPLQRRRWQKNIRHTKVRP